MKQQYCPPKKSVQTELNVIRSCDSFASFTIHVQIVQIFVSWIRDLLFQNLHSF